MWHVIVIFISFQTVSIKFWQGKSLVSYPSAFTFYLSIYMYVYKICQTFSHQLYFALFTTLNSKCLVVSSHTYLFCISDHIHIISVFTFTLSYSLYVTSSLKVLPAYATYGASMTLLLSCIDVFWKSYYKYIHMYYTHRSLIS